MGDEKRRTAPQLGIDPTVLARCIEVRPPSGEITHEGVVTLCRGAIEHRLRAVSLPMAHVRQALNFVRGTGVGVSALIGPLTGEWLQEGRIQAAREAVTLGVQQITVVLDAQSFRAHWGKYSEECAALEAVVRICRARNAAMVVKALLPVEVLTESEYRSGLERLGRIDVDFVGVLGDLCVQGFGVDPVTTVHAVLKGTRKTLVWNGLFDTVERPRAETPDELDLLRVMALEDMIRGVSNEDSLMLSTTNAISMMEMARRLYAERR